MTSDRLPLLLIRLLAVCVPVIAILVAAAFVLPENFPYIWRQVLLAAIGVGGIAIGERLVFDTAPGDLMRRMGLVAPSGPAMRAAITVSLPIWLFLPIVAMAMGKSLRVAPDWAVIIIGVALVNGLAEEVIHRACFFGRLRERTRFVAAAGLGAALFGAQHLYLLSILGWAGGLASIGLAVLLTFPLCRAFEKGGRSIAGPAVLHSSANGAFLVFGDPADPGLLMLHMLVVLGCIYSLFLINRRQGDSVPAGAGFNPPAIGELK